MLPAHFPAHCSAQLSLLPGCLLHGSSSRQWRLLPSVPPAPLPRPLQAADPEFYRTADSLKYGAQGKVPEANIDRMVAELNER